MNLLLQSLNSKRFKIARALSFFILIVITGSPLTVFAEKDHIKDTLLRSLEYVHSDSVRADAIFRYIDSIKDVSTPRAVLLIKDLLDQSIEEPASLPGLTGRFYFLLGLIYRDNSQYTGALETLYKALAFFKTSKDIDRELHTYLGLGAVLVQLKAFDEGIRNYNEGLGISRQTNMKSIEFLFLNELGICYDIMGHSKRSIAYFEQCVQRFGVASTMDRIYTLNGLSLALKKVKRYDASIRYMNMARIAADSIHSDETVTIANINLGAIYLAKGMTDSAWYFTNLCAPSIRKYNEPELLVELYKQYKAIYTRQSRPALALAYADSLIATNDSLYASERTRQARELQVKYDTKAKDLQLSQQDTQISYQSKLRWILLFIIALIIGVVIYISISLRKGSKANRLIAHQKQELEETGRVKDKLFSVISHDLRTPVNTLLSFADLLDKNELRADKIKSYSAVLRSTLLKTSALMNNLLHWAASQMHGFAPVMGKTNVYNVADRVINELGDQARQKGITIHNNIPIETIVLADEDMLSIILRNVVANAIKYVAAGTGEVSIKAEGDGKVIIEDNGTGMPATDIELFNGGSNSGLRSRQGTANEQGTGLGLMLCGTLVKLMNGQIKASPNEHAGTTFTIHLQCA